MAKDKKPGDYAPQAVFEPKDDDFTIYEYGVVAKEDHSFITAGYGEQGKKTARSFCKNSNGQYFPAKRLVHTAEPLKETD